MSFSTSLGPSCFISFQTQIQNQNQQQSVSLGLCSFLPLISQNFILQVNEPISCLINIDTQGNVILSITSGMYGIPTTITPSYSQTFCFPITSQSAVDPINIDYEEIK